MPRGFLVKRLQKHSQPSAYRIRRFSDEDRSDSSSDHDDRSEKSGNGNDGNSDKIRELRRSGVINPDPAGLIGSEAAAAATLLLAAAYRRHSDLKLLYATVHDGSCSPVQSSPNATSRPLPPPPPPPENVDDWSNRPSRTGPLALTTTTTAAAESCSPLLPTNLSLDRLTVSPASHVLHTPTAKASTEESIYSRQYHKKRLATGESTEYGGRMKSPKKSKAVRRLHFDEDKSSPVSGTIIRELDSDEEPLVIRKGDIDPSFNVVEVTDEAKAEIAKIENKIGDYVCQLCKEVYDDAFGLAQHRCSRIVHVEYRCPECDKVFNCPANLASHRRWHKPRPTTTTTSATKSSSSLASLAPAQATTKGDDKDSTSTSSSSSSSSSSSHGNTTLLTVSLLTSREVSGLRGTPSPSDASSSSKDDLLDGLTQSQPTYDCEQCGKRFRRQTYLRRHLTNHHASSLSLSSTTTTTTSIGASIFIYDTAATATATTTATMASLATAPNVSPAQQQLFDGNRRHILSPTPLRQQQHNGGVLHQLLRTPSHPLCSPIGRTSVFVDTNGNNRSNNGGSLHQVALEKLVNSTACHQSHCSSLNGNHTDDGDTTMTATSSASPSYDCKYDVTSPTLCSPNVQRRTHDSGIYQHVHRPAASGLLLQMVHTVEATQ